MEFLGQETRLYYVSTDSASKCIVDVIFNCKSWMAVVSINGQYAPERYYKYFFGFSVLP